MKTDIFTYDTNVLHFYEKTSEFKIFYYRSLGLPPNLVLALFRVEICV